MIELTGQIVGADSLSPGEDASFFESVVEDHGPGDVSAVMPAELARLTGALLPAGHTIEVARDDTHAMSFVDADGFHVAGLVRDAHGDRLGFMARQFLFGERSVYHDRLTRLSSVRRALRPLQEQGLRVYDLLGLVQISVLAGLSHGPTIWADAGFQFADPFASLNAVSMLGAQDPDLLSLLPDGLAPWEISPQDLLGLTDSSADYCIADFANAAAQAGISICDVNQMLENRIDIRVARPLGEAVLHAIAPWRGVLSLAVGGAERARYEAFLRR